MNDLEKRRLILLDQWKPFIHEIELYMDHKRSNHEMRNIAVMLDNIDPVYEFRECIRDAIKIGESI